MSDEKQAVRQRLEDALRKALKARKAARKAWAASESNKPKPSLEKQAYYDSFTFRRRP